MEPETICNLPMIKAEYRRLEPITGLLIMDSASAFIRAVITKAKLTWMKLMQCNSQRSLKLSRLSFVLAFWGTGSHHGKPAEIPWVAFDGFRLSAAAHSCFSEMG